MFFHSMHGTQGLHKALGHMILWDRQQVALCCHDADTPTSRLAAPIPCRGKELGLAGTKTSSRGGRKASAQLLRLG